MKKFAITCVIITIIGVIIAFIGGIIYLNPLIISGFGTAGACWVVFAAFAIFKLIAHSIKNFNLKLFIFIVVHAILYGVGVFLGFYFSSKISELNNDTKIAVAIISIYLTTLGASGILTLCFRNKSKIPVGGIVGLCFLFVFINQPVLAGYTLLADIARINGVSGLGLTVINFICPQFLPFLLIISCIIKRKTNQPDLVLLFIYLLSPVCILVAVFGFIICAIFGVFAFGGGGSSSDETYIIDGVEAKKIDSFTYEDIYGDKYEKISDDKVIRK